MMNTTWRAGLITGVALIAAAACSKNGKGASMDDALRADLEQAGATGLELAPKAGRQTIVSPIEGGPRVAPPPAAHRVRIAVQRSAPRRTVAARAEPVAPARQPTPQSQPQQRQPGVYSTEAEIFRQMPWIRP